MKRRGGGAGDFYRLQVDLAALVFFGTLVVVLVGVVGVCGGVFGAALGDVSR
ncbi:MAG: hypothetical protein ACKVZJ_10380 [Phycisphaerales bacterium]